MQEQILMPTSAVLRHLGGISQMTLWRWERDENLGFPAPVRINRRKYFRRAEIEEFINQQGAVQ